jgi:hypothetical protein
MVNIITPALKIRRIPVRSPQRPTGSRNMAVARRNAVTIQLSVTAFRSKAFSMAGRAMFIDDIRNVLMKAVIATIAMMEICLRDHFIKLLLIDCFIRQS